MRNRREPSKCVSCVQSVDSNRQPSIGRNSGRGAKPRNPSARASDSAVICVS